jgi:exonuclease SbcC
MIPRTIQIQNFLSYGPTLQTIDFSPYNLICLSGKNGHGKSALLDAITWALWGQARKVANSTRSDQGLLRLNQTKMMVILDFEIHKTVYRVKREFEIVYGKPYASLEFGMYTNAQTLSSLSEKTLRDTQACIEKIIGLDFDTFVNSAFLRQGNANEFSKRSPKERKEIIISILGLGTYDVLRKAAHEKIKKSIAEKQLLVTVQNHRLEALKQWNTIQTDRTQTTHDLITYETQYKMEIAALTLIEQELVQISIHEKAREQCLFEQKQLMHALHTNLSDLTTNRTAWRKTHRLHISTLNIDTLELKKEELRRAIDEYHRIRHAQLSLREQIVTAQGTLQAERLTLEQEQHQQQQQTLLSLERVRSDLKNTKECTFDLMQQKESITAALATGTTTITQLHTNLVENALPAHDHTTTVARFEKRKEVYQRFIALGNFLHTERAIIAKKISLQDQDNPSCPLCEQNLSATRKRFLHTKLTHHMHIVTHRINRLVKIIPRLKNILVIDHKNVSDYQTTCANYTVLQSKLEKEEGAHKELFAALSHSDNNLTALHIKQKNLEQEIQVLVHTLAIHSNNESLRLLQNRVSDAEQTLALLNEKVGAIRYDQKVHEKAEKELSNLDSLLRSYDTLRMQTTLQSDRKKTIQTLCTHLRALKIKKKIIEDTLYQSTTLNAQKQNLAQRVVQTKETIAQIAAQKEQLIHRKGSLDAQHTTFAQMADAYASEQQNVIKLDAVIDDYTAIAFAASKDGIQALLIEDALPEIEQEANNLLAKLTHNQAQIMIESLRDLKKGGTKETLDIKISDTAGIRPYELFSGGEAFRIDFALRISISKLLARRAGTALQTLIIDEGFGSQDEEGLSLIMDALYAIQDDFAKIIIVSHLSAMKDQFPVHFVVEKIAQGSMVHVIEQG